MNDRERERVRPIGAGGVDSSPRRHEQLGPLDVARDRGGEHRRHALGRRDFDVGTCIDESGHDVVVRNRQRPHQSRGSCLGRRRIYVGAMSKQGLDDLETPSVSRNHQRGEAAGLRGVGFSAGGEQDLDHPDAGILAGPDQRRDAMIIRGVGVRPVAQEQTYGLMVVPVGGPKQRGRAVSAS